MTKDQWYLFCAGIFMAGIIANNVNLCLIGLVSVVVAYLFDYVKEKHNRKPKPSWGFIKEGDTINFVAVNGQYSAIFTNNAGKYGFCDEMWADTYGPFNTYSEACAAMEKYVEALG